MFGSVPFGIALGSNLGDRKANLEKGMDLLMDRLPGASLAAGASLYETEPVGCEPGTQSFLNTVVEILSSLSPTAMHAHLLAVEAAMGRPEVRLQNAPRTLDLDVLYAGNYSSSDPALTVPHPRLHVRRFVLQPLAEIRPSLQLPGLIGTVAECLAALPGNPADVRLAGGWHYRTSTGMHPEGDRLREQSIYAG